jgi:hypothetical protein
MGIGVFLSLTDASAALAAVKVHLRQYVDLGFCSCPDLWLIDFM